MQFYRKCIENTVQNKHTDLFLTCKYNFQIHLFLKGLIFMQCLKLMMNYQLSACNIN